MVQRTAYTTLAEIRDLAADAMAVAPLGSATQALLTVIHDLAAIRQLDMVEDAIRAAEAAAPDPLEQVERAGETLRAIRGAAADYGFLA